MSKIAEAAYGDRPAPYPASPGFKRSGTSQEAAQYAKGYAATLREKVFAVIATASARPSRGMTADEVAEALETSVLSIRPRLSELAHSEPPRIEPTKERRANESGRSAIVWRIARCR